ncbi:MAG: metallophosphatase domain-containing protein [Nitrososphaerales archaeon]
MKIVAISDTHTKHKKITIPKCDVLVHAGDFSWKGTYWETFRFMKWLNEQPAKHKIVIAGNHELTLDASNRGRFDANIWAAMRGISDVHYLDNSSVTIDGIKFYGTPWTPFFYDWAFNGSEGADAPIRMEGNRDLVEVYGEIPEDTQVLICHGPPRGIVDMAYDERAGSYEMRKLLESDKLALLRLYLCGHIHEGRGHEIACGNVNFCNVSSLGRDYSTAQTPVVIDLDEFGNVDSVQGYEE